MSIIVSNVVPGMVVGQVNDDSKIRCDFQYPPEIADSISYIYRFEADSSKLSLKMSKKGSDKLDIELVLRGKGDNFAARKILEIIQKCGERTDGEIFEKLKKIYDLGQIITGINVGSLRRHPQ